MLHLLVHQTLLAVKLPWSIADRRPSRLNGASSMIKYLLVQILLYDAVCHWKIY